MIAKIMNKVIRSFKYFPDLITNTGKSGNAARTYLGIDENEPENVGTISARSVKIQ